MVLTDTLASASPMKAAAPISFWRGLFVTLNIWRERARMRAELASLTNCELRDFGASRADALAETSKPFWRA